MTAHWKKLGLLYCPEDTDRHPKLATHAANPLPVLLEGNVYRVFYSGRDSDNRSSVGAVDIDIVRHEVVRDHHAPFFLHGPPGSFHADGVSLGCSYSVGDTRYLLFMGWQNPPGAHWRGDIGRLTLHPDWTLTLDSDAPFMTSEEKDPVSLSYPWVWRAADGSYRMWYGSTIDWDAGNGEMLHVINQASSNNGHDWHREGLAVPYELGVAQAFSKPVVIENDTGEGLSMWFSCRGGDGGLYRIGRADSADGVTWQRVSETAGIDVSAEGWDSDMIEYPHVFAHAGQRYMLYNGNGYGKSGFGLAVWSDD